MQMALREAELAAAAGEVPAGAVVVRDGEVLSRAGNRRERDRDPTAHAEILALREAARGGESWRLEGATVYVTKEPCIMCAGAMVNARVKRVVYGCPDAKGGGTESLYRLASDERLNHQAEVVSGVLADECRRQLQEFFRSRRNADD